MRIDNKQIESSVSTQVEPSVQQEVSSTLKAEVSRTPLSAEEMQLRTSQAGVRSRSDISGASLREQLNKQLGIIPDVTQDAIPDVASDVSSTATTEIEEQKPIEDPRFQPPFLTDAEAKEQGIENFAEVRPGLFRGGAPKVASSFEWLHDKKGVSLEIDLRMPDETPRTARWAAAVGFGRITIPMDGYKAPTAEQVNKLYKAIPPYDPTSTKQIFMHDAAGQHRMGMMTALIRVREGVKPDDAIREMVGRGFEPLNVEPDGPDGADIIDYITKFGDAYQSLKISSGSEVEPQFVTFFTNFWNENRSVPRSEFTGALSAAFENNGSLSNPSDKSAAL